MRMTMHIWMSCVQLYIWWDRQGEGPADRPGHGLPEWCHYERNAC